MESGWRVPGDGCAGMGDEAFEEKEGKVGVGGSTQTGPREMPTGFPKGSSVTVASSTVGSPLLERSEIAGDSSGSASGAASTCCVGDGVLLALASRVRFCSSSSCSTRCSASCLSTLPFRLTFARLSISRSPSISLLEIESLFFSSRSFFPFNSHHNAPLVSHASCVTECTS
jgi:hypothetical protein